MEISYRGDSTYVVVMIMYSFNGFFIYILTFIPANVPAHMVGPVFFIQLDLLFFDLDFPPLIKLSSQLFICTNALQLMK